MPTASNGDIELVYDIEGSGPPLLLIAGTSADRSIWGYVRPNLAESYRTIAFDNRDAGQSSMAGGPYGATDLVADALAVLDAAGVHRAHVLGHSMGGMVAQELAIMHPKRIASLTLTNTWARADTNSRSAFELARDLTSAVDDDALRLRALYFMGLGPAILSNLPLAEIAAGVIAVGPLQPREALTRQWTLDLELDTLDQLRQIRAPTHVMWSTDDRFLPALHARQLVAGIAGAVETRFEGGVGHCPMIEIPEGFVAEVLPFLALTTAVVAAD